MTASLKKIGSQTGRFILRGLAALAAGLFILVVVVQIILFVGLGLASTGAVTRIATEHINAAIEGTTLEVSLDRLSYDPIRGISLRNLAVSDRDGIFLTLDRLSLSPSLVSLPLRSLQLTVSGGTMEMRRLPALPETDAPAEPLAPFALPDIYFRTVEISRMSFERVVLAEDVAGAAYDFAPSLSARAQLSDTATWRLSLQPGLPELAPNLPAPGRIAAQGVFDPAALLLSLEKLDVTSEAYDVTAAGRIDLAGDGALDVLVKAEMKDLAALTAGELATASAEMTARGPLAGPALDIRATLKPAKLAERGVTDIDITLTTADIAAELAGHATAATMLQGEPVTLDTQLAYAAPVLHLRALKGTAPGLTLTGDADVLTDKGLVDGKLSLSARDLSRFAELAGVAIAGKADIQATLKPQADRQAVTLAATFSDGVYDTISFARLTAEASLDDIQTPWPQSAKADISRLKLADDVSFNKISARIEAAGADSYKLSLKGDGRTVIDMSFDGSARLSKLTQSLPDIRDLDLTLRHDGAAARITGLFTTEALDLKLATSNLRGRHIPADLSPEIAEMTIGLSAAMTGTPAAPRTTLETILSNINAGDYKNATIRISAEHDGKTLAARLSGEGQGIRKLSGETSLPLALSLMPFHFALDDNAPLSGRADADIDLAAVAALFLPPTQKLEGTLNVNATVGGTLQAPVPAGTLSLGGASFTDTASGIALTDIEAAADVTRERFTLKSLSATDGKQGKLDGKGFLSFTDAATDISLRLRDFTIEKDTLAQGIVGADLSLKGASDNLLLAGTANIEELQVIIPERFSSSIPQLNIVEKNADKDAPSFLDRLALDIAIKAENRFFVRGWGLDAEFGGTVAISGKAAAPQFNGTFSSRRGRFEEFGRRFTLTRANLRFQGDVPPSPYLDIEATVPAGDVTAAIVFSGPVEKPAIKFSSTPALPQDEVLSRILFGKEATKISAFQAVQLAQTIRRFSGNGGDGLDPLGMLRDATGLDDISVETDDSGATNVGVGKYLTDKVYLEFNKGQAENSGAAKIQVEVSPSINVESKIGQDAQSGAGIFWKKDY